MAMGFPVAKIKCNQIVLPYGNDAYVTVIKVARGLITNDFRISENHL
jgi:hypothetical protein